ncbi:class I SAM-dependent methyltransferase [Aspergillus homomorphus CBS 101889]|uniref:Putative ubiE/COQ5 methyltransferase n=1 Tax=Aspergillus homomorphus (strain CBS 101889) TaxID=1450537 RepID=A0A395HZT1_ASPHC|nr:putative ubiE/COQ5 methyltransferase [Aspergillus homomorphus CBS 101889]RAL12893.1 putative ubiE/COQ5 methyltransferase [Aspergillus homomorphus CBS 101889]
MTSTYSTNHAASVLRTHNWRTLSNSAPYLLPHLDHLQSITPNLKILDIGCGPGSITIDLARRHPAAQVIGIDSFTDPLPTARRLAASEGLTNITFAVGDTHALNFPDNTFDVVHVHQVLQHIADPVQALREMHRVAKPDGGLVAARESSIHTWYPANRGIELWDRLSRELGQQSGGNPHPGARIHVWAEEAGFARTQIRKTTGSWCFSSDEEREYWGGSMAERARNSGFADRAVESGLATKEELDTVVEGWLEFVGCGQAWYGMLHGEIVCFK